MMDVEKRAKKRNLGFFFLVMKTTKIFTMMRIYEQEDNQEY